MDILYLSQYFYPEQFLNNHVAKELAGAGHRVDVVCCVPNYPSGKFFTGYSNFRRKEERWEGVDVHRVFTIPRGRSAVQLVANFLTYPVAASWRIWCLGSRRGAISFVSMPSPLFQALAAIFAKWVWKIPTVYWVQDIWPESAIITLGIRNRFIVAILNAICGFIYRQADLVMVQSDGFHQKVARFGVSESRIVTLPNCAPPEFNPVETTQIPARIRSLIPEDRRTIMFAGNIGESQDFDTIIQAAKLLPDESRLLIVIVGSGRDEDRVRNTINIEGLEERFLFLGRHPESDMPFFFACATFMLVSLRDEPIFSLTIPSKIQAYLACAKPILGSLAGEGAEIIANSNVGIVVPPSNPARLAAAMCKVIAVGDEEISQMGNRARHLYEAKYSMPTLLANLTGQLSRVLAKNEDSQSHSTLGC